MSETRHFNEDGRFSCKTCFFSVPLRKDHWLKKYYPLECKRFPPTPDSNGPGAGPFNLTTGVSESAFCGEYKSDRVTKIYEHFLP